MITVGIDSVGHYRGPMTVRRYGRALVAGLALLGGLAACSSQEPATIHSIGRGIGARILPEGPGSNQGWIELDTFVLIVDSNVLDTELELLDTIRETTAKPIRFVVNTHFHGDHVHGNGRLAALGAEIIAAAAAGPSYERAKRDFDEAKQEGHRAFADLEYAAPTIWFEQSMTIAEAARSVELLHLGPAHTAGDTLVWVPDEGVLFTGDVVANQHLTYLADGHIDNWIAVLEQMEQLPVRVVIPGHGPPGDLETIRKQRSFLSDLRDAVAAQVKAGITDADEIARRIELPDHPLWRDQPQWFRRTGVRRLLPRDPGAD